MERYVVVTAGSPEEISQKVTEILRENNPYITGDLLTDASPHGSLSVVNHERLGTLFIQPVRIFYSDPRNAVKIEPTAQPEAAPVAADSAPEQPAIPVPSEPEITVPETALTDL